MKKKRSIRGFTMAELLIVVAIITVLSGVGFVAVQAHQKNVAQLEANTVAKEIFFAAQNHLTMAEAQGYLNPGSVIEYGESKNASRADETADNIYYFAFPHDHSFAGNNGSVLDMMLPFGAIDETVRSKGNYVIRYQANPARVLDVWYGRASDGAYQGKYAADPGAIGIVTLLTEAEKDKPNYGAVIGHYGGDEVQDSGVVLNEPYIEVENAERLLVRVRTEGIIPEDANGDPIMDPDYLSVTLIVKGKTSGVMAAIPVLPGSITNKRVEGPASEAGEADKAKYKGFDYIVTLDDITRAYDSSSGDDFHFNDINDVFGKLPDNAVLIPGEDITVQAVAFSNLALASITNSNEVTTNSLFAEVADGEAKIANFRHLENLDQRVSGVNAGDSLTTPTINSATQMKDLVWAQEGNDEAFTAVIPNARVYTQGGEKSTDEGYYLPVQINYAFEYDGGIEPEKAPSAEGEADGEAARYHQIIGVKAKTTGSDAAGMFGEVTTEKPNTLVTIKNLELIDFNISSSGGSAGALVGKAEGMAVANSTYGSIAIENVLARNSSGATEVNVSSSGGSAGGLVGEMDHCSVQRSAAALIVKNSAGNAGGLIGASGSGWVIASYSGGHTIEKKLPGTDLESRMVGVVYDSATGNYNVTASASAGGLIGEVTGTQVLYCYSTCSAYGTTAGGLVGKSDAAAKLNTCYATGLVGGTTKGAFAGEIGEGLPILNCQYLEIINEQVDATTKEITYLDPVPGMAAGDTDVDTKLAEVTRIDADTASYDAFVGDPEDWEAAEAYLGKDEDAEATAWLDTYYAVEGEPKYNFKTVKQLGSEDVKAATDDAPADFVAIHYGDWPAPEVFLINESATNSTPPADETPQTDG